MTQHQLNRSVARATGESYDTIAGLGFSLVPEPETDFDDGPLLVLDCPACGREVLLSDAGQDGLPELAECSHCNCAYPYAGSEIIALDRGNPLLARCA